MKKENIEKGKKLLDRIIYFQEKQKIVKRHLLSLEKSDYTQHVRLEIRIIDQYGRDAIFMHDDDFDIYRLNIVETIDESIQKIINYLEGEIEEL